MTAAWLRVLVIVLCIADFVVLAPAIVHARDNTDRLYLVGGALMLAALTFGSAVRLHAPFNPSQPIACAALVVWLLSAWKSRQRRRGGGRG